MQVSASDGTDNATDLAWTIIGVVMPVVTNLIILPNQVDVDTTPAVFYNYTGLGTLDVQINWYINGGWVRGNFTMLSGPFIAGNVISVEFR